MKYFIATLRNFITFYVLMFKLVYILHHIVQLYHFYSELFHVAVQNFIIDQTC